MVTKTYKSWAEMKARCKNRNRKDFTNYGGRGITYDPRWESYANFRADMGKRPDNMSLDRIDNSLGYFKDNCRWATPKEQNNNRRDRTRGTFRKDNSSGTPGVFQDSRRGAWYARIYEKGKAVNLYYGPSKEEAIRIRLTYQEKQNRQLSKQS